MLKIYNLRFIFTILYILAFYFNNFVINLPNAFEINDSIISSPRYASLIINSNNGEIIHQHNADTQLHPASLTKMMTAYICFQEIKSKRLSLNTQLPVSARSAAQIPTKLWLKRGERIQVRDALQGIIIRSANDAAVTIAEAISGSEDAFALRMTLTARKLGMSNTIFKNASGLHHPQQFSTASDLAKLSIALRRDFPEFYHLFSKKSFKFKNSIVNSRNKVLARYQHADGLKTGYVTASGFNLATSATKPEGRIVAVVMGGPTAVARDNHMIALLDKGFSSIASSKHKRHLQRDQDEDDSNSGNVFNVAYTDANEGQAQNVAKINSKLYTVTVPSKKQFKTAIVSKKVVVKSKHAINSQNIRNLRNANTAKAYKSYNTKNKNNYKIVKVLNKKDVRIVKNQRVVKFKA